MIRRVAALAVLLVALGLPAVASAQQGNALGAAVQALRSDPVYVAPDAETQIDAGRVRRAIRQQADGVPVYVAVLPASVRIHPEETSSHVLGRLATGLDRRGVYAGIIGDEFRGGSTGGVGIDQGVAPDLATSAFQAHPDDPTAALVDFIGRIGAAHASGGGGSSAGSWIGIGVGVVVIGGLLLVIVATKLRGRARDRTQAEELRAVAREDRAALGDDIRALDLDVEMPGADAQGKRDYATALDAYEEAGRRLEQARRPSDLEPVTRLLADGRYAMECAKARLAGREPPERRPPCFFDPRHGTSSRDVLWAPDFGEPRTVPACEADARRVERGDEPDARQVDVGGQRMPYWHAPAYYGPWAGGYYGGFGGGGLLTGLLAGSLLASAWGPALAYGDAGGWDGGDFGGGGGFGGGDFGGGGFGGGDFGGGDFGGGGDF